MGARGDCQGEMWRFFLRRQGGRKGGELAGRPTRQRLRWQVASGAGLTPHRGENAYSLVAGKQGSACELHIREKREITRRNKGGRQHWVCGGGTDSGDFSLGLERTEQGL